jgi:hypothetical protein
MALAHSSRPHGDRPLQPSELVDALYELAPEEFGAARDKVARRLRAAGLHQDAVEVKRLRRPSPAAWALNTVARSRPHRMAALLEAARRLRVAHDEALAGSSDAGLRAAQKEWRRTVLDVVGDAQQVLAAAAVPVKANVAALTALVEAVAAEPDVADALRRGRLVGDETEGDPGHAHGIANVTSLDGQRPRLLRNEGGGVERRRTEERERLAAELGAAQRHLAALRARRESVVMEEASTEERVAEARRRLERAEASLRKATIARHKAERDLQEGQRAVRHVEERLAQLDDLLAGPRHAARR